MDINTGSLRGKHVYLEKLSHEHDNTLRQLARDERLWEFTKAFSINEQFDEQFDAYINTAHDKKALNGQEAFVIKKTADNSIIGMTRFYDINAKDKRLAIGYTWYIPEIWGKPHNKECKLLLLQYVFEEAGFYRTEFHVAHQNIRSQKAVEKIGGVKEGLLRNHGFRNDGSVRHTVMYSIVKDEWPEKKENLLRLISANEKQ
jgi:RimJ/RimL family protein N-acetyltransferase